jgi:DNA-binding MarR family transcriptional regulator
MNLVRTTSAFLDEVDRWRRPLVGLSAAATQILTVVEGAGEPLPPHTIAERLLVTSGTMTSLLDTLERRKLIRRIPHPDDRRKILVDITPEARRIVDMVMPLVHATSRDAFSVLSARDRRTLVTLLGRVQGRLAEMQTRTEAPAHKPRKTPRR